MLMHASLLFCGQVLGSVGREAASSGLFLYTVDGTVYLLTSHFLMFLNTKVAQMVLKCRGSVHKIRERC